ITNHAERKGPVCCTRRILTRYTAYYNKLRTHRSLNKDAPVHRAIQHTGCIVSAPVLGGLHHHYSRRSAVADLEELPWQPYRGDCVDRSLCCSDDCLSATVRMPQTATTVVVCGDPQSDGRVAGAPDHRSVSVG